jgi:hypothetical protein
VLRDTEPTGHYYYYSHLEQRLGLVEAQNFAPSTWAPGAEGASGATGYARDRPDPQRPVFVLGSGRGIPLRPDRIV